MDSKNNLLGNIGIIVSSSVTANNHKKNTLTACFLLKLGLAGFSSQDSLLIQSKILISPFS